MSPRVAVAAPSSAFDPERFETGLSLVRDRGISLRVDPAVYARDDFLAGDDAHRVEHLRSLLADDGVDLIWAARGGYGAIRTLAGLDDDLIRRSGKTLLGFSDLTIPLNRWAALSLPAWHGPVVTQVGDLDDASRGMLVDCLSGRSIPTRFTGRGLVNGVAQGAILGGNLASLAAAVGTPFMPDLTGAILLLEDVNEAPYRIDRMLTQLELAGALRGVAGVAAGRFTECGGDEALTRVFLRRLGVLGIPVVFDLPFGHGPVNQPVRLGAAAHLDGGTGALELIG
jgi:muramoyltetrapeptide carboxypeptidase